MGSPGETSWQVRPDKGARGVGVLIDTEYLSSDSEARRMNPYYIVINGSRYYGPTPEEVVQRAREHPDVKASIKGEAAFRANARAGPQQTALPARNRPANAGSTMKRGAADAWQSVRARAAAAAAFTKNTFKSKPAASGAASAPAPAPAPASGAASQATPAPAPAKDSANSVEYAGNPRPGEGVRDKLLPGTNDTAQRGGRRMTKKRGRRRRDRR